MVTPAVTLAEMAEQRTINAPHLHVRLPKKYHIISLDIESSGTDYQKHALLSIGLVDKDGDSFYVELQHKSFEVVPQAMRVNQIQVTQVDLDGPHKASSKNADQAMLEWLNKRMGDRDQAIAMGLNIGSFDMPFVRRWLPRAAARFSYRTMDLNSLIFERSMLTGKTFDEIKHELKKAANDYARDQAEIHGPQHLGIGPHNALFDAYSNWGMLYEIRRKTEGT